MSEILIQILPSGEIMVERSADPAANAAIVSLLAGVVDDITSLSEFLEAQGRCEQIFGDEPLCG